MESSFQHVIERMTEQKIIKGAKDFSQKLKALDPKQRKVLELFREFSTISSKQIGALFGFKPRTSAKLCANWVQERFLEIVDFSNKGRKYCLHKQYAELLME